MLTSQPLRAGQVRVNLPVLTRLYAQVEIAVSRCCWKARSVWRAL